MWYGNDTLWRSILDINHMVYYTDKHGRMKNVPQRKVINIGDMIVCGDHEGPLHPSYKKVGGILFADNPVLFDLLVVRLMGFDWHKFPTLVNAVRDKKLNYDFFPSEESDVSAIDINKIDEISIMSNDERFNKKIKDVYDNDLFHFVPTNGWKEYL